MSATIEKYLELKRQVDEAQRRYDRIDGAVSQLMKSLTKFGCDTLGEAEKKIEDLSEQIEEKEEEFDQLVREFESEWKEALNEEQIQG